MSDSDRIAQIRLAQSYRSAARGVHTLKPQHEDDIDWLLSALEAAEEEVVKCNGYHFVPVPCDPIDDLEW